MVLFCTKIEQSLPVSNWLHSLLLITLTGKGALAVFLIHCSFISVSSRLVTEVVKRNSSSFFCPFKLFEQFRHGRVERKIRERKK